MVNVELLALERCLFLLLYYYRCKGGDLQKNTSAWNELTVKHDCYGRPQKTFRSLRQKPVVTATVNSCINGTKDTRIKHLTLRTALPKNIG
jgi:hypothetical protein